MSYATLRQVINERFKTNWTYTPVAWDNFPFDANDKKYLDAFDINDGWVRITIQTFTSQQVSIENTPLKRVNGQIVIQIFTPKRTGTIRAETLTDNVAGIFEDQSFSSVVCRATSRVQIPEDAWYQVNASTPFHYDYT